MLHSNSAHAAFRPPGNRVPGLHGSQQQPELQGDYDGEFSSYDARSRRGT